MTKSGEPHTYEYERPALTVDVVIFTIRDNDLKILLIKRDTPPYEGMWAIPGGFVQAGETLPQAARRELFEETNVQDIYLEQLYTFGDPGRDPRGWTVTVAYFALISSDHLELIARTDARDVGWFSAFDLPELAFDHQEMLDYAINRLQAKLDYSSIGFQLLPEKFTLTELQRTYEIILCKELDKRNFRKKIISLDIVHALEEFKREGNHRPARLYKFAEQKFEQIKDKVIFPF